MSKETLITLSQGCGMTAFLPLVYSLSPSPFLGAISNMGSWLATSSKLRSLKQLCNYRSNSLVTKEEVERKMTRQSHSQQGCCNYSRTVQTSKARKRKKVYQEATPLSKSCAAEWWQRQEYTLTLDTVRHTKPCCIPQLWFQKMNVEFTGF